jgi:hypothetical protein
VPANPRDAKLAKLLEAALDLQEKLAALFAEMQELLAGGVGIGAKLKRVEQAFDRAWGVRYAAGQRGQYVWNYKADRAQTKRLLKRLTIEQLEERALRYLASDDSFFAKARHPFGLFVSSVNRFTDSAEAPPELQSEVAELGRPIGCNHNPACRSDQEHTRKKQRELRS